MPSCGAPACENRSTTNSQKSFHRLPTKKDIREKWLAKIKRENILIVNKLPHACEKVSDRG